MPVRPLHHHAVLQGRVRLYDSGLSNLADIEFPDGFAQRVRLTPRLLRRNDLDGTHDATLFVRTTGDGQLRPLPRLIRLQAPEGPEVPAHWSVAGRLVRVEQERNLISLRIFPERAKIQPFLVTVASALPVKAASGSDLWLTGQLRDRHLWATSVTPVRLERPGRWQDWGAPADLLDGDDR